MMDEWQIYDVEGAKKAYPTNWQSKIRSDIATGAWANTVLPSGKTPVQRLQEGSDVLDVLGEMEDFAYTGRGLPKPDRSLGRRFGTAMKEGVVEPVKRLGDLYTGGNPYLQDPAKASTEERVAGAGQAVADFANTALIPLSPLRAGATAVLGFSGANALLGPSLQRGTEALEQSRDFSAAQPTIDPATGRVVPGSRTLQDIEAGLSTAGSSLLAAGGPLLLPGLRALGRQRLTPQQRAALPPRLQLGEMTLGEMGQGLKGTASGILRPAPRGVGQEVAPDFIPARRDQMAAEAAAAGIQQAAPVPELEIPAFQRRGLAPQRPKMEMIPYQEAVVPEIVPPMPPEAAPGLPLALPEGRPVMGPEGPGQFQMPMDPRASGLLGLPAPRAEAAPVPAPGQMVMGPAGAGRFQMASPEGLPPARELTRGGDDFAMRAMFEGREAPPIGPAPAPAPASRQVRPPQASRMVAMPDGSVVRAQPELPAATPLQPPAPAAPAPRVEAPQAPRPAPPAPAMAAELRPPMGQEPKAPSPDQLRIAAEKKLPVNVRRRLKPIPDLRGRMVETPSGMAHVFYQRGNNVRARLANGRVYETSLGDGTNETIRPYGETVNPLPFEGKGFIEHINEGPGPRQIAEGEQTRDMGADAAAFRQKMANEPMPEFGLSALQLLEQARQQSGFNEAIKQRRVQKPPAPKGEAAVEAAIHPATAPQEAAPAAATSRPSIEQMDAQQAQRMQKGVSEAAPKVTGKAPAQQEMLGTEGDFALAGQQEASALGLFQKRQPEAAARQIEQASRKAIREAVQEEPGPKPVELVLPTKEGELVTRGAAPRPKVRYTENPQAYLDSLVSEQVPVSSIKVHPSMQYKRGADSTTGIVTALKGKFSPFLAGDLVLWKDNNGNIYPANGHHRFDDALKSGERFVSAKVLMESEGVTFQDAKNIGAEMNFVEGKGTYYDNAKMIRDRAAEGRPIPADHPGVIGRGEDAWMIATHAIPDLWSAFMASEANAKGSIKPRLAAAIIRSAGTDQALQRVGMRAALERGADPEMVIDRVNAMKSLGREASQGGLFGEETFIDAENIARTKRQITQAVRDQVRASQGAIKNPEGAKKMGVNIESPEAAKARLDWLKAVMANLDDSSWASHPDIVKMINDVNAGRQNAAWDYIQGKGDGGSPPALYSGVSSAVADKLHGLLKRYQARRYRENVAKANIESLAAQAEADGKTFSRLVHEWQNLPLEQGTMGEAGLKRTIKMVTAPPSAIIPKIAWHMSKAFNRKAETEHTFRQDFIRIIDGLTREQIDGQLTPAFMEIGGAARIKDPIVMAKAKQLARLIRDMDAYGGDNQGKLFPTFFGWNKPGAKKTIFIPEEGVYYRGEGGKPPLLEEMFLGRLMMNMKKHFIYPALDEARLMAEDIKDPGNKAYAERYFETIAGKTDPLTSFVEHLTGLSPESQAKAARFLNLWTYRALLGFAPDTAFKNLGQGVNPTAEFGPTATARAMAQMLTPEGRRLFKESGVIIDALSVFEQPAGVFSKRNIMAKMDPFLFGMMKGSEFFNRGVSWHAAIFEGTKAGLKGRELYDFAKWAVDRQQFRYDAADTNPFFNNPAGKLFYQFHSYPTKQAYFLYQMVRAGGDRAALIRHLALTGMLVGVGASVGADTKDMMSWGEIGGVPLPYVRLAPGITGLGAGGAAITGLKTLGVDIPSQLFSGNTQGAARSLKKGLSPFAPRYPIKVIEEFSRKEGPRVSRLIGVQKREW